MVERKIPETLDEAYKLAAEAKPVQRLSMVEIHKSIAISLFRIKTS